MYFPVLIGIHPMIGCDLHGLLAVPPGVPPPVPYTPHITVAVLQYLLQDDKISSDVLTHNLNTVNQFHDIGKLIGHVPIPPAPVNAMLLKIIPFSSSKVMYGSPTVLMNNKPMACGLLPMLNCGEPCPFPVGVNVPITNVFVGMSFVAYLVQSAAVLLVMGVSYLCSKTMEHLIQNSGIESFIAQQVADVLIKELIIGPKFNAVSNAVQQITLAILGVPAPPQSPGEGGGEGGSGSNGEGSSSEGGDSGSDDGGGSDGNSSGSSDGGDSSSGTGGASGDSSGSEGGGSTPEGGSGGGGGAFMGVAPDTPGSQPTDEMVMLTRAERFVGRLCDEIFDLTYPDTMEASAKAIEKEAGAASARKFMDTREPYKWKEEFRELSVKSMAPQLAPHLEEFRKEQEEKQGESGSGGTEGESDED